MSHPCPPRYIKYTIVESHEYPAKVISVLPWRQQAALFLGFFQMAGFNRYAVDGERRLYVDLLEDLDVGTYESSRAGWLGAAVDLSGVASRDILRKEWRKEDLKAVPSSAGAADLAEVGGGSSDRVALLLASDRFNRSTYRAGKG